MKKIMFFLIISLFILLNFSGCFLGTYNNPIKILNAEDLLRINREHFRRAYYRQESDIDLSEYDNWIPIDLSNAFFDGNGYKIKNLTINDEFGDYQGLFGRVYYDSAIENVYLENISIVGGNYVGGLAALNSGRISNCYVTGKIQGNKIVGGIVGINNYKLSDSFSNIEVLGKSNIGGMVGYNRDTVINSYSISKVIGDESTGGLIGYNENGIIENSYYDLNTSFQNDFGKGEGKTTEQMMKRETYVEWDFDFIWGIQENTTYPYFKRTVQKFSLEIRLEPNYGGEIFYLNRLYEVAEKVEIKAYPEENFKYWTDAKGKVLSYDNPFIFNMPQKDYVLTANFEYKFSGGNGTRNNPYLISTSKDLENVKYNYNKYFKQIADIDLSKYENWEAIGLIRIFNGNYDGNNHKISNLKIQNKPYKGLFSQIGVNGEIKNLILENMEYYSKSNLSNTIGVLASENYGKILNVEIINSSITADRPYVKMVGGVAGYNAGIIENVKFEGDIKGLNLVGGVVGLNEGRLINVNAVGDILGNENIGGVVGMNNMDYYRTYMLNAYASGTVTGKNNVGGLVGSNGISIRNSYSSSLVTGESNTGGLIGNNIKGNIRNSYYDNEVSGQSDIEKGERQTTEQMMKKSTYNRWDFKNIWEIIENETYPFFKYEK